MSKQNLVDNVANQLGGTKADAAKAVDAVLRGIAAGVQSGDRLILPPLGTFSLKTRAERQARNPRTGEKITVAAREVVTFKPSKQG